MSLDKVESSNPNLTAAHAGASTGGNLAPATKCFGCYRCRRAVVLRFRDSLPSFEYSPSRGKSLLCFAKQPFCHFCALFCSTDTSRDRVSERRLESTSSVSNRRLPPSQTCDAYAYALDGHIGGDPPTSTFSYARIRPINHACKLPPDDDGSLHSVVGGLRLLAGHPQHGLRRGFEP